VTRGLCTCGAADEDAEGAGGTDVDGAAEGTEGTTRGATGEPTSGTTDGTGTGKPWKAGAGTS
jgi:hypothetical protein